MDDGLTLDIGPSGEEHVGLFSFSRRLSHACAPNACWYSKDPSGTRVVRSLTKIPKGVEVCISYLSDMDLLRPAQQRLAELQSSFEFVCTCSRCCSEQDDMRVFPCTLH